MIIFNEGQPGRTDAIIGTLGAPTVTIPVIGTTYAIGAELYNLTLERAGDGSAHDRHDLRAPPDREHHRRLARKATTNSIVVVGAHLDSVAAGPGINDNGSGTAAILEIAIQVAEEKIKLQNKLRFAFWGAEESGLLGSAALCRQPQRRRVRQDRA